MLDIVKICNRVIEYSLYALFFLVPLALTPWNYELFEFNKMLVVYFLTTIIVASWFVKMVITKKVVFRRSFWDIPLILFLTSQVLSFLFSIDHHTSLWGYYSRFNGGLLSTICYLLLYWAFVSNLTRRQTLCTMLYALCSAALVAAYGIAEHLGIDAQYWVQDVKNRVFSTLGQPNWLAAWLVTLVPLTWALGLNSKLETKNSKLKELTFYILHFTFYICLLYTRSRSGLFGFAVAFAVFWPLVAWVNRKNIKKIVAPFLIFTFSILLLSFIAGRTWIPGLDRLQFPGSPPQAAPQQPTSEPSPFLISESGDIRRVVWKGAVDIWRHHPILGTGPETFAYSYYWYRPREHNDLSEWDFLYNKAHNEYLNLLATTGTVGLASYLLIIAWYLVSSIKYQVLSIKYLKTKTKSPPDTLYFILNTALIAGFASILVTNFFGFSVVPISLLFFLFPAMAVVLTRVEEQEGERVKKQHPPDNKQYALIALILLFTFYFLLFTLKYWYADTQFSLGEKFNKARQYNKALVVLQKAVQLWPSEPFYHDELSTSVANLAVAAFQQNQATLSAQLADFAVSESDKAIKTSPYHLNFWKNRTKVFYTLSEIDQKYTQLAILSLIRAAEIAPTDAKVQYNLGLLYAGVGQQQTAIKSLEKTVELKPNYIDARYALALFYEQAKEKEKAVAQLKYIIEKINPNYPPALEKLKEL